MAKFRLTLLYSQTERLITENGKLKEENKTMKEELLFFRLNHKKEHLLFLYDFSIPFDNNETKRSLKLIKTKKKASGQVKSIENGNEMLILLNLDY